MTPCPAKLLASALALAFVLASTAEAAQPRKPRKPVAARTAVTATPYDRGVNLFPPGPVMYGNEYLGDDPDPFIRLGIARDLGARFGGPD
jgi:hypothetical protein